MVFTHHCRFTTRISPIGIGMVSTQLFCTVKTISCNSADLPLLLDDCMDAGARAMQEQLPRELG